MTLSALLNESMVITMNRTASSSVKPRSRFKFFESYHFRNRDYSATLGRWVTLDPIRYSAGNVDLYRYESNKPMSSLDHGLIAGRVVGYNYAAGLDSTISRLSSITDSGVTLESYSYLGLSTAVVRSHAQSGVDLSYVKLTGEAVGDAGDPYAGLDRFGRIVDQRWRSGSTDKDRNKGSSRIPVGKNSPVTHLNPLFF